MLALVGFMMVFVIIFVLIQGKVSPMPIFVIVPIVAAVITGFTPTEIFGFIRSGVTTTMPLAVLFIFSIVYFGVMNDTGLFDPMVDYLVKVSGSNYILVTVATTVLATIGHLDGAFASTILITIPAMLPIYKRLKMRPVVLLACIGAAMAIMNLVPWGGPVARIGAILDVDLNLLWQDLIPMQIAGIVLALGFAVVLGIWERRRVLALNTPHREETTTEASGSSAGIKQEVDLKAAALKRPKLIWFNALLTLAIILMLTFTKIPLFGAFMIGLALALIVNFPNPKDQTARMKAHAGDALSVPAILLASGIFLGVLRGTKMIDAMAAALIYIVPDFLGPYLHLVFAIFSVPIGMLLGTDSYFFGLLPLAIGVGERYGITPENMSYAMLIGKNYGVLVTPHAATTYLAIGLAGVELKDHLKFCVPFFWILSILALIIAIILGIVTI